MRAGASVSVCVCAYVCVELLLRFVLGLNFTPKHYLPVCVCWGGGGGGGAGARRCVGASRGMCMCVVWVMWVGIFNYASRCTSVLSFAYVYMLTAFRDTFLVKPGE